MKQCPACGTSYTDDTLRFCLADGAELANEEAEVPTVVRAAARSGLPTEPAPTVVIPRAGAQGSSRAKWAVLGVIGVLLGLAALAVIGIAGFAFFYGSSNNAPAADGPGTPRPTSTPARPTPTPDRERERVNEEIANLQRMIEERKRKVANQDARIDPNDPAGTTATVDSPNDGFLALRSIPDADRGERIAKIPHGEEVLILRCDKQSLTVGGRYGRWCRVAYNGLVGWVFDAWLEY